MVCKERKQSKDRKESWVTSKPTINESHQRCFVRSRTVNQMGVRKSSSIKGTKRKKSFNEEKVLIVKPEPFFGNDCLPLPFTLAHPLSIYPLVKVWNYFFLTLFCVSSSSAKPSASSFEKVSMKPQGFDIIGCLLFITILLNKLPIVWCQ